MEWRQLGDVKWRDRLCYVGAVLNVTQWLHQETAVKFVKWSQGVQFTNSMGKVNRKNILQSVKFFEKQKILGLFGYLMMCNWTLEVGLSCSSGNRGILNQCELHFHEIIHLYGI